MAAPRVNGLVTDPPRAGEVKLKIVTDGTAEGSRVVVVDGTGAELGLEVQHVTAVRRGRDRVVIEWLTEGVLVDGPEAFAVDVDANALDEAGGERMHIGIDYAVEVSEVTAVLARMTAAGFESMVARAVGVRVDVNVEAAGPVDVGTVVRALQRDALMHDMSRMSSSLVARETSSKRGEAAIGASAEELYEIYCGDAGWKNHRGELCPPWVELPADVQRHWQAVAAYAQLRRTV